MLSEYVVKVMLVQVGSFVTFGPQWLPVALLQLQGFLCKTAEGGLPMEPNPSKLRRGLSGSRWEGVPRRSLQSTDWGDC